MKIFITKKAKKGFDKIRDYIVEDFGELTAREFDKKVNDFIDLLEVFPELGSIEVKEKGIRGFVIAKQTKVFYRIKDHKIIILTFFEVRRRPKNKLK